ncbi:MBG domain-containing protein [Thioclava pacifica]|uniref:Filamentous haemagglutinin FhaB/tRNA nuclease CdiA-like TPS domain-containing protein n=1 Tax=Thioclava pacifica DSM 10166 TaxID=1353537 RepID=A0A074K4D6_9RHOB|nr:MBG domain-containing protein [Thioclava pacifica]KEO56452.1 hypothetical protein TP2_02685 [Thioclava pacifica DSM 10166]
MVIGLGPVCLSMPVQAENLPVGGQVVTGSATITAPGADALIIRQDSDKAIVNWSQFNIGAAQSVDFQNGSGATLNRVTGGDVSTLSGQLSATGSVYLINPAGVIIGPDGVVTTGGDFVVSTQGLSDGAFLGGGDLTFAGSSKAQVLNLGTITAQQGDVALIARQVENDGTISAPNGTAALAAGYQVVLRGADLGDGKIEVQLGGDDTGVINRGTIEAASAELRANGGNVYALAGNRGGEINATGVARQGGRVFLTAGATGHVAVSQKITSRAAPATSPRPPERPVGRVTISGQTVDLSGTIDARGPEGGAVKVTGATITQSGTIDASAEAAGAAGGSIELLASGALSSSGDLIARGGAGGQGGFVETSGHTVDFTGLSVDTRAEGGPAGLWLVDPEDITVDAAAASVISANLATSSVMLQTTASTASGTGTITPGAGDISIDAPIAWASDTTLTLDAYHAITINAAISPQGGGSVALNYDASDLGNLSFGLTSAGFKGRIDYGATDLGSALSINGTPYTLLYSLGQLDAADGVDAMTGAGMPDDPTGNYALATSLDAQGATYSQALVNTSGISSSIFDGLGNTVSNLSVHGDSTVGLFGVMGGTLRDIGVDGGTMSGVGGVGGLVGFLSTTATVFDAFSTAAVEGRYDPNGFGGSYGGLVGSSLGTIRNSFSTGTVRAENSTLGGLVGANAGTIRESFSTASVTFLPQDASFDGSSYSGGLVGYNSTGGKIRDSFAMGAVSGWKASGGLVGYNRGAIETSFATGAILNQPLQTTNTYGTGTGAYDPPLFGGLVGYSTGTITNSYFDRDTAGTPVNYYGGTALVTSELQNALPTGFDPSVWATGADLYPYLKSTAPDGLAAVSGTAYLEAGQYRSVYVSQTSALAERSADNRAVPEGLGLQNSILTEGGAAARVALDSEGARLLAGSVGANGTYYLFAPADRLTAGSDLVVSAPGDTVSGMTAGARVLPATTGTLAPVTTADLYAGFLTGPTDAATLASLPGLASLKTRAAAASGAQTQSLIAGLELPGYQTSAARFDIDAAYSGSGFLVLSDRDAPITVSAPLTITDGSALALLSGGALNILSKVSLQGGSHVALGYDTSDLGNLSFGLTPDGFVGSLDYGATDQGGTLVINRQPYVLVYSADAFASRPSIASDAVNLALAHEIDASSINQSDALIPWTYYGRFNGLGHVIRGGQFGGLFGDAGIGGLLEPDLREVRDLGFEGGQVTNSVLASGGGVGGTIMNVYSTNDVTGGNYVGGLVNGVSNGGGTGLLIRNSFVTGSVSGGDYVGGLVGWAVGPATILNSYATGDVTGASQVGGLIGGTNGNASIRRSFASAAVTGTGNDIGGLIGLSADGDYKDVYASGDVTATGPVPAGSNVGGLIGRSSGDVIAASYASGAVSGLGATGGLVGAANGSSSTLAFYDSTTTGQLSDAVGATPLTTAQFMDTAGFMAGATGWDFANVWSPPGDGYDPQLYALSPVIWVSQTDATAQYGDSSASITSVSGLNGGPQAYAFGPAGDSLDLTGASFATDPTQDAGLYATALPTQNTLAQSALGIGYRVFYFGDQSLTISPRPITVTAASQTRLYGDANAALSWTISGAGFVNGDSLSGALATQADVTSGVGSYDITQGTLSASPNYALSFVPGTLTVTPRALSITAEDRTKTYGDALVLDPQGYTVAGLVNSDTVDGVTLSADGLDALDLPGLYPITPSDARGRGLGNYDLSYLNGRLSVSLPQGFVPMPPIGPRPGPGREPGQGRATGSPSAGHSLGQGVSPVGCGAGEGRMPCAALPYATNWQPGPRIRFEAN